MVVERIVKANIVTTVNYNSSLPNHQDYSVTVSKTDKDGVLTQIVGSAVSGSKYVTITKLDKSLNVNSNSPDVDSVLTDLLKEVNDVMDKHIEDGGEPFDSINIV